MIDELLRQQAANGATFVGGLVLFFLAACGLYDWLSGAWDRKR